MTRWARARRLATLAVLAGCALFAQGPAAGAKRPSGQSVTRAFAKLDRTVRHVPSRKLRQKELLAQSRRARKLERRGRTCDALKQIDLVATTAADKKRWKRFDSSRSRSIVARVVAVERLLARFRGAKSCVMIVNTESKSAPPQQASGGNYPGSPPSFDWEPQMTTATALGPFRRAHPGSSVSVAGSKVSADTGSPDAHAAGFNSDVSLFQNTDASSYFSGGETSAANAGNVVFYTGNFFAGYSSDGGQTFTALNPYNVLPAASAGFCCDQDVIYVPQIDRFVWLIEYISTNARNYITGQPTTSNASDWEGTLRIAVASPQQIVASHGTSWTYWNLTPRTFGITGQYQDFGHLAVGANNLYLSYLFAFNGPGANVVFRIPLSKLARPQNLGGERFLYTQGDYYRPVAQNTGTRAVFAKNNDRSQLEAYAWDEGSNVVFHRHVGHSTTATVNWQSMTPAGDDWLARGPPGWGITAATRTGDEAWFGWSAARDVDLGNNRTRNVLPQPHIQIAVIDVNTLRLIREQWIYNPNHAFRFPAFATNSEGEVGFSFGWGGGPWYANSGVGILTHRPYLIATALGAGSATTSGQDYSVVRQSYPATSRFSAANYVVRGGGQEGGSGPTAKPYFTIFGRAP